MGRVGRHLIYVPLCPKYHTDILDVFIIEWDVCFIYNQYLIYARPKSPTRPI
jgi:hypothetical protein